MDPPQYLGPPLCHAQNQTKNISIEVGGGIRINCSDNIIKVAPVEKY